MSGADMGLNRLALNDLKRRWRAAYGNPPPPRAGRDLLELGVGWHLQSKAQGGLDRSTREQIAGMTEEVRAGREPEVGKHRSSLAPGATLVREWNGRTYQVQVLEAGYLFEDRVWRSLSQIARQITGARWNGPKFFGLRPASRRQTKFEVP